MAEPDYEWVFKSTTVEHQEATRIVKSYRGDGICVVGDEVEIDDEGANFSRKSPQSCIQFPEEIMKYGTEPFSIAMWFKTVANKHNSTIFGNREAGSNGEYVCLRFQRGQVAFEVDNNGDPFIGIKSPNTYYDGEWHHIVAVRNGATSTLFMDGEIVAEATIDRVVDLNRHTTRYYAGYWFVFHSTVTCLYFAFY